MIRKLAIVVLMGLVAACTTATPPGAPRENPGAPRENPLLHPESAEMQQRAPDIFRVKLETTKGNMVMEVHRDWSPIGVDHYYNLLREGYYNNNKVWRIRAGYWAQWGINADPKIATIWRTRTIKDDPRKESNVRGTVAFAFSMKDGRSTQLFVNLRDNSSTHDAPADGVPFVPIGKIVEGIEVADAWNAEYAETAGGGIRGGQQDVLFREGATYWEKNYPRLDGILKATIVK